MNSLHGKTLKLLKQSNEPLRVIAKRSKLPYEWLVSVRYNRIKNPNVNRIQRLYEYLTGGKLPV